MEQEMNIEKFRSSEPQSQVLQQSNKNNIQLDPQNQKKQDGNFQIVNQMRQDQQKLYQSAFSQRKKVNIDLFKNYYAKRCHFFHQRLSILMLIQNNLNEKSNYTKSFIKEVTKYFQEYLQLYEVYFKGMGKLNIQKKPKDSFIYESIFQAVSELSQGNNFEVQKTQNFTTWIEKMMIPTLKTAFNLYSDPIKELKKQFTNCQKKVEQSRQKQVKLYQKLDGKGDLLQNQILLVQKVKKTNEELIEWGKCLISCWEKLIDHQQIVRTTLKQNILDFAERFMEVYNKQESIQNLVKFWKSLPKGYKIQEIFGSFFTQKNIEEITLHSKQKKLMKQLDDYIRMQHQEQKIGNPFPILKILQNKKFKVKVPKDKTQRQWFQVQFYFTVDKNILLFKQDQGKIHLKVKQKGASLKRISQNILEMTGIEQGFILDSKRKQLIHFETIDSLQQFVCFVEMLDKQGK